MGKGGRSGTHGRELGGDLVPFRIAQNVGIAAPKRFVVHYLGKDREEYWRCSSLQVQKKGVHDHSLREETTDLDRHFSWRP